VRERPDGVRWHGRRIPERRFERGLKTLLDGYEASLKKKKR
jgi:hypothetical protein